jgi:glycosyltransferase involved in cell wall biosynthesis
VATVAKIGDLAAEAGLRRIHVLAWRDLDDIEAGGSELHADRVARLWAEAGLDVTMRTSFSAGSPSEAVRSGYRVIRRGGRYMVFPRAVLAELTGGHGIRDGLVEIWNGMPFLSPAWARHPRVVWIHQPHTELWDRVLPRGRAAAGRVFERDLAPRLYRSTPVVTLSETVRRQLVDGFRLRPERVHVVPPGVDDRFVPNPRARDPEPLLVAVGRLTAAKQFDRVIRVVARLRERAPARLVIAGSGTEMDRLQSMVSALGAEDWCELAGHIDDGALTSLYQRAWVLLSASSAEGWGMTITEAAACGTPSVVSDVAGHADAVADGETGHLAARDVDFVDALERLIVDRGHRERLGETARARAARLTWERTAHDTLAVLAGEVHLRHR